jgi:hypothetical protein
MGLFDDDRKYYPKQLQKELSKPNKEIVIVDDRFVFDKPARVVLTSRHGINAMSFDFAYTISGIDGKEYFKCMNFGNKKILLSADNEPILGIYGKTLSLNYEIYAGDKKERLLAKLTYRNSHVAQKFSIIFTNLVTENEEYMDFNCEEHYRSGGVFYGKEKEGAPMICKFIEYNYKYSTGLRSKSPDAQGSYLIEMAANVDNVFLMAVGIVLAELDYNHQQNQKVRHRNKINE